MAFDQFEVVVVPFPFTDKLATKRRPAVVLSKSGTFAPGRAIMAMITSSTMEEWPLDVVLTDLNAAGLTSPCRVRFKVFTLDEEHVVRSIGKLSGRDRNAVRSSIEQAFLK